MKIQNTSFNPEGIRNMGFEAFEKVYKNTLRGDLKAHYETITGEKVKKTRTEKAKDKDTD